MAKAKRVTIEKTGRGWWGITVSSGCDEWPGNKLSIRGFGHSVTVRLPRIIAPYRERVQAFGWTAEDVARIGRDWYWRVDAREYGLTHFQNHFSVRYGRSTMDSSTNQVWSCFLPWNEWRHVRKSLYLPDGSLAWQGGPRYSFDDYYAAKNELPKVRFNFRDFDGAEIVATTHVEESEWTRGVKLFRWLRVFFTPKVARSLLLDFSAEVGPKKGSWKGGTVGHSIDMLPAESIEEAFKRYCVQEKLTFVGAA